ncbi:hypothetical protein SAMN04488490_0261 [Marinobacter sp. LV10R510-11A]|uniref:hypothetical protein n=1 Tax=Marinobacter sp. LV10R510-11A TaxID=1415568 RepID=UPI000BBF9D1F|nr:hypothetical protein [Marinobacter sp. LV10R510-11A]SOB74735.1 hypothetical protein SAMN04488490_0261 [Marinobacter sp. LV10R510-11A]
MANGLYLGYSDYLPNPYTRITCVAKAVAGQWRRDEDFSADLPPFGKAFAVSLSWLQLNQPVAITAVLNPRTSLDENKDQFIVDQAKSLRQVVDFRKRGMEAARAALLENGVVRVAPRSSELIAAISDTQCAVITLSEHPVSGRLVAPSGAIKLFKLNPEVFSGDKFDDQFLEIPGVTVGEFQEEIHWQMDQDLLDTVLKRLKKFDEKGPSKTERERIISVLNRASALAQEQPEWDSLNEWLESYSARAQEHLNSPEEVAVALSDLAPVRDELELIRARAAEELRCDLEPVVRAEIEKDLSELYDQWDTVEEELEKEKTKLGEVLHEYENVSKTLTTFRQQLFTEVAELNGVLGDIREPDSESSQDLVDRLKESLGSAGALIQPVDQTLPPWARVDQSAVAQPVDFKAFTERLSVDARRVGLNIEDLSSLDIALRSGALTILPQAAAEIVLPSYANAATGGEFVRQPLGPGVLSLDDLWTEPVRGALTAFARAWNAALKNSERFYLVWLDGLQRTPMDVWLPSLVGVLASQHRPKNLLIAASLDAPLLDRDRIFPNLDKVAVSLTPSLSGLRPANFLTGNNSAAPQNTVLITDQPSEMDSADLLDYLDDVQEKEEGVISLEAGMFRAACHYAEGNTSATDILKQTTALRDSGRSWLKALFEN